MRMANFTAAVLAVACAVLLRPSGASAAPLLLNGDFEAGTSSGWDPVTPVNTPGWVGVGDEFPRLNLNQACGGPYGGNNSGCQFVTIGGVEDLGTSRIEQTVSGFVVGDSYVLSWLQSSEFTTSDVVNASIAGASTLSQDFTSAPYPGGTQFWFGWEQMSLPFTADASTLTFSFASYATNFEPGIDSVQLSGGNETATVPEPASLLLLGTGLIGVVRRLRRLHG